MAKSRAFGDQDCFHIKKVKKVKESGDNIRMERDEIFFDSLSHSSTFAFSESNEATRSIGARVEQYGSNHIHIHYYDLLIENHEYLTNFAETSQSVFVGENIIGKGEENH